MNIKNLERWMIWAVASAVGVMWLYPVWAIDYYRWDRGEYRSYGFSGEFVGPTRWEKYAVVRSRDFLLNWKHGDITHDFRDDDEIIRHANGGPWELRTRFDIATNLTQTVVLLAIAGGALYVFRKNRQTEA
jgi:hypothetical protein